MEQEKNDQTAEKPEGWPLHDHVISSRPVSYVIGKHTEDVEIEVEIEGDTESVSIKAYLEVVEYLESNPTGNFNLSIPHKQKKVGAYQ